MAPLIIMAPLHGITNRQFRRAWFAHFGGVDSAMAPFVAAVGSESRVGRHFKDLLPRDGGPVPLIPQVMGNDAELILQTAGILAEAGYAELNWNLGCPFPMVAKRKRGSGLLPHADLVASILDKLFPRLPLAFSVKVRLGRKDPRDIDDLMPVFNAHPLSRVIIHPRVGTQMYRGSVDLEAFAAAAEASVHPVVYNGDITDAAGFETLYARFPKVNEWMIGRGLLADPFLPARIKGLALPADPPAALRAFHDDLYAAYRGILSGPGHTLDKMKEIWRTLGASFPSAPEALQYISRARSFADYEAAVDGVFAANP